MHEKIINDDKLMVPEYFVDGQPHEEWRTLRQKCPVYWSEPKGFRPYWSITKFEHIREVERRSDVFINEPRFVIASADFEDYMARNYGHINDLLKILVQMDAPEHTKHRQMMQPWFLPKELKKREEAMDRVCRAYFEKLRQRGQEGEADFTEDLAFWYPLRVACALLGTPPEDDAKLLQIAEEVLSFAAPQPGEKTGFEKCLDYCTALAAEKRQHPGDDFATYLVQAEVDNQPLNSRELLAHFLTVITAGHDTTSSTITCGMKELLAHPDQLALLRQDRSLLRSAADEMIRWTSPTVQFARTAAQDYELGGQLIREGDALCLCFSSANRDADAFENPDSFDITRWPNDHLGFGSGAHSCLGSQLARMEVRLFLNAFLDNIETMEVIGPTPWFPANMVTRIKHMPVRYRFFT
jgi:cytochrome P450